MKTIPAGVFPTMITPYDVKGRIDYDAIDKMVEWYIAHQVAGVFAVCQSSEMFYLDENERVALARHVVRAAAGRIAVVASGHISDRHDDQVRELSRIAETGVDAVVLVSNRLAAAGEDDAVLINSMHHLISALDGVPLGMYECPQPYKRLLSDEVLLTMVDTGRFAFVKDTCCDADTIRHRLALLDGRIALYNANTATLLESLRSGAAGYSGIMGNIHPQLYVWLQRHYANMPEEAENLAAFLTLASGIERGAYPDCAKYHMVCSGISMETSSRSIPGEKFSKLLRVEMDALLCLEAVIEPRYAL